MIKSFKLHMKGLKQEEIELHLKRFIGSRIWEVVQKEYPEVLDIGEIDRNTLAKICRLFTPKVYEFLFWSNEQNGTSFITTDVIVTDFIWEAACKRLNQNSIKVVYVVGKNKSKQFD